MRYSKVGRREAAAARLGLSKRKKKNEKLDIKVPIQVWADQPTFPRGFVRFFILFASSLQWSMNEDCPLL